MPNKTKQINIRVSNEVYDTLTSEAKKQKITLTKLCCQGINFLIANLYSAEINNSLKKTCTSQSITSSLENSTSVIPSLDFEMSQLQEMENRISNVERALVQLLGTNFDQLHDMVSSSNELNNSSSVKSFETPEEAIESLEKEIESEKALHVSTNKNSNEEHVAVTNNTVKTANTRSSRKTKSNQVSKVQDSPSKEEQLMNPSKSGKLDCCPHCQSSNISKNGHDRYGQQMYHCKNCKKTTIPKHGNVEVELKQ